jgi:hypothetical protein
VKVTQYVIDGVRAALTDAQKQRTPAAKPGF